jgi:hypothetical protein
LTPVHVQFPGPQFAVHKAPSSHVMLQLPGPAQFIVHFEPFLQSCVQPPTKQLNVQSASFSHVCLQPAPPRSHVAVQIAVSWHWMSQPVVVHVSVQSSFFLHSHFDDGAHASV